MNQTFNIQRFSKYFLSELFSSRKKLLIMMLGVFVVFFGFSMLYTLTSIFVEQLVMPFIFLVISFIAPFMFYSYINDRIKGIAFITLPVSSFEKTLSYIILCAIIVPLLCGLAYILNALFINTLFGYNYTVFPFKITQYHSFLAVQSIALLGNVSFKGKKFQKTVATMVVIIFIFIVLLTVISVYTFKGIAPNGYSVSVFNFSSIEDSFWRKCFHTLWYSICPFGIWLALFFKFKEQEY